MATAITLPSPFPQIPYLSHRTSRIQTRTRNQRSRRTGFPRMVINWAAPARNVRIAGEKIYKRLDSCLVVPPPNGVKPQAFIKFLGGAFVGAVPEVTYSHLMELLAKEGFLVVSVPYNVTFDHSEASREVFERFHNCVEVLLNSGLPDASLSASDVISLPLYSVGHSNGALLQLLVGSYYSEKIPEANVIVSFNNKPASEAVPYFEQFGPVVSQVMPMMEANPMYSLARNASGIHLGPTCLLIF
ncbi:uncharacterized protein LOC109822091 isoform X1 [Asparagus officinalis]|uniref:uncharacterized protein LOC109822091 isoform X1 n=2 Tax=Asparagus officinalis TaxID=4686 RepID=UPI00098E4A8B|nr:uncharacterized protein LOC109822091 isoform X1 [Asparagus officinalis]